MGLLSGSVSATKFYVRGDLKKNFAESFLKAVRVRVFQELSADEELEERSGWCVSGKPLDLDITHEKMIAPSLIFLSMRVDRWRIPRPLFKAHFEEAVAAHVVRTGRDKLSKREKDDIKQRVNKKLRRRLVPAMRTYDLCWDLHRREIRFWNRSARVNEDLRTLFEQTFGSFALTLDEESPFMAAKGLLSDTQLESLSQLEAASFATQ